MQRIMALHLYIFTGIVNLEARVAHHPDLFSEKILKIFEGRSFSQFLKY